MKRILALLILILFAIPVAADEYPVGYLADGYSYAGGGLWSLNGQNYTRSLYQQAGYWYCGAYYPGKFYYQYTAYNAPAKALPSYGDPGWRGKLIDAAVLIRKNRDEQAYYIETVKILGLEGLAPPGNYGMPVPSKYMPYEMTGLVNYGVNGNSQFGYSYNTVAAVYGDTSLSNLFQLSDQHVHNAQTLSGQATSGFQALLGQEGANRAKVAEIIVKADAAHKILMAMQDPALSAGYSFKISPSGTIQKDDGAVAPALRQANADKVMTLLSTRCASCHSGSTKKGGFDVSAYPTMALEAKQKVWHRLLTDDDKLVMPRLPDGGPGRRLSPEESRLIILN